MPFSTPNKFKSILTALSILRYMLKSSGATGTTDAYKHSEKFFETILNHTYGLNLRNMNYIQNNYPAIDLGDREKKVCFQVTGENSSTKINKTIKTFFAHDLNSEYDKLKFLVLTTKKSYSKEFSIPSGFDFDKGRDILDVDDILKEIESRSPETIDCIFKFIENELSAVLSVFAPKAGLLATSERRLNLPFKNAKRLIDYLEVEPEEHEDLQKSLKQGYSKLTTLSKELREYIFVILNRGRILNNYGEKIGIVPVVLEGILTVDTYRQRQMYAAASDLGFVEVPEGEYPPILYLFWGTPFDVDLFVTFRKMFGRDSDELKKLLVDGDFSLLDK